MNDFMTNMGQRITLEQWNRQKEMQAQMEADQAPGAGVWCQCGAEMKIIIGGVHPGFNIYCNPNNLTPGLVPNVRCPSCGKVGRKA